MPPFSGRHQKGLMQSRVIRNLKFGKDKLVEKVSSGKSIATRTHREHGGDMDVEEEGISRL